MRKHWRDVLVFNNYSRRKEMPMEQELSNLRERVVDMENQIKFLYNKLNIEYAKEPSLVNPQIIEFIKQGNKIEAIKTYRETHNVGLAEAKKAVEEIQSRLGL